MKKISTIIIYIHKSFIMGIVFRKIAIQRLIFFSEPMKEKCFSISWIRLFLCRFSICLVLLTPGFLNSQDIDRIEFLRLTETALQTPIYTLSTKDTSTRIKVIGVIHVGDLKYYQYLQKIIRDLDFLFYEGIRMTHSPQSSMSLFGVRNEPERTKQDVKSFTSMQNQIANSFRFVEQADHLRPESNWINADVNLNQFTEILQKTNLSLGELSKNYSLDNKNIFEQDNESRELIKTENDAKKQLLWYKKKMAWYLFKSAQELCYNEEMKVPREAIIIERNKVALSYLKEKLSTPNPYELGLLYGAAHIPHFIQTLQTDHDLEIISIEWIDAWSLKHN